MRPDDTSIAAVKLRIDIEHSLDVIIGCRYFVQAASGIPKSAAVDDRNLARPEVVYIHSEYRCSISPESCLKARIRRILLTDHEKYPARDRLRVERTGK